MRQLIVLATLAVASPAMAQEQLEIRLLCEGTATGTERQVATSDFNGSAGSAFGTTTLTSKKSYPATVRMDLGADGNRLQPSMNMIPPINSGSKGGWWQLSDVVVNDSEITAKTKFNFMNTLTIRVSRTTGQMELRGMGGGFVGKCAPETATEKLF